MVGFLWKGEIEFFLLLRWIISDVLYTLFINAAFYAAPCLELENEQGSRMQGFLIAVF